MTSLLPIQYVTPHSITSTSASSVVELNSTSNTEKQRQQQQQQQRHPHFQQQRWYNNSALTTASLDGSLPSVTVVKPRSTPNATTTASNTRLAYVDALVDVNALVIELIWQLNPAATATSTTTTTTATSNKHANKNNVVVPLRTFIQEFGSRFEICSGQDVSKLCLGKDCWITRVRSQRSRAHLSQYD
ncbi:hypothetical protein G6F42_026660 [Rhizopus arrhizus]|nr:hypothetical protein G6F42_026660 [Rhizopus arrhizus]